MKYPITRERLQNYGVEARREEEAKRLSAAVEYVSECILASAARKGAHDEKRLQIWTKHIRVAEDDYTKVIAFVKERFPDTDIQIDPMKTYILVDWS